VNLLAWGRGGTEIAQLDGNLVVRLPDYITGETMIYTFIGEHKIEESLAAVLPVAKELVLVPEAVACKVLDSPFVSVEEDRDSDDYIYDVASLANLEGGEFKKKRNKANSFAKSAGNAIRVEVITTIDEIAAKELRAVFRKWVIGAGKSAAESAAERAALNCLLANKGALHLRFTVVRVYGEVCAFSVNEVCSNEYAVCHFEKALPLHEGLYAFVIQQAAKDLHSQAIKRVNWQQDLGLPGLRQAKTAYHPIGFLKKYTITLA
jgi:hypothetical protein